jgi:hypothetical protein
MPQNKEYASPIGLSAQTLKKIHLKVAFREALARIRAHPLVANAKQSRALGDFVITVKFTDGITEVWALKSAGAPEPDLTVKYYFIIDRKLFADEIPIYHEFESSPLSDNHQEMLKYFIIQKKDIRKSGFCQVRFMVHELVDKLVREGWSELKYPQVALKKDLEAVKKFNHKQLFKNQEFSVYQGNKSAGSLIIRHFIPCGDIAHRGRQTFKEAWRPEVLNQVLNQNLRSSRDITRASIIHFLGTYCGRIISGPKIPNVNIWASIFKIIGTKTVYDIDPNFGEKAIAAAALGIGYRAFNPNEHVSKMISWLNHKNEYADVTIITNIEPIDDNILTSRLRASANTALGIITREQAAKFKPTHSWPIRINPIRVQTAEHMVAVFQK